MKVILLKDIDDIGGKYEIKEVKDGYARNYLIPRGLAKKATPESLEMLQKKKEEEEQKAEEGLRKSQELASKMDGKEVEVPVKLGKEGQLFESINNKKIQEGLKKLGFSVKKNQIALETPIKELGEFPVKIKLSHNLEAEIIVTVVEE